MSLFSMFSDQSADPVDRAFNKFYQHKLGEELYSRFLDPETDMRREQMELDIEYKRRQLGLPMDDDMYEDAINNDTSYPTTGTQAVFGRKLGNSIPAAGQTPDKGSMLHFMGEMGQTGNKYDAAMEREAWSNIKNLGKETGILRGLSGVLMNPDKGNKDVTTARNFLRILGRGFK